jgi:NhaP-type Na+/H+ or K+/H+ antiporter
MIAVGVFVLLVFLSGLVSRRAQRTIVTGPMAFTAAGLAVAFALPGLESVEVDPASMTMFSEIALALLLFTDASRIKVRTLRHEPLPARLLAFGMPLTVAAGILVGAVVLAGLSVWESAILATILAPTDASLGQVVVSNERVPARIRQALAIEGGLNDGMSLPFLMLFVAIAQANPDLGQFGWITYTVRLVGYAMLIGCAVGWLGGWLMHYAEDRGWMTETFAQLCLLALALIIWGGAEALGGNGFIAAFLGGMFVKVGFGTASERMVEFSEAWGELLTFGVFYIFGMLAAEDAVSLAPVMVVYAALSLTVVRMAPVAIALIGSRLKPASVAFMGWFGPRGLASVVLGFVFLKQHTQLPGEPVIMAALVTTVMLSIVAHGISAVPGVRWYARRTKAMAPDAPELQPLAELPA